MSDKEKSQTPEKKEVKVLWQKITDFVKKNVSIFLVLIIVLFLLLIPTVGLLFFKLNSKGVEEIKTTVCEKTECPKQEECEECEVCEVCKETECTGLPPEGCPVEKGGIINPGWLLLSSSSWKLSMEVPVGEPIKNKWYDYELLSRWKVGCWKPDFTEEYYGTQLGTHLGAIQVHFSLLDVLSGPHPDVACGGGSICLNGSYISIDVFRNESKTLDQIYEAYKSTFKEGHESMQGKKVTRWNVPVYELDITPTEGHAYGYLLVKNGFTYKIIYDIGPEPAKAASEAKKMLDSIRL